jgi:hypothetical protein
MELDISVTGLFLRDALELLAGSNDNAISQRLA